MAFSRAWAPLAYDGAAGALVRALKERGALRAADVMAAPLAALAPPQSAGGKAGVLVPVPADPLRRRRRGVDHTTRLAAALAARSGRDVAPVLRRGRSRAGRQAGTGRSERLSGDRLAITVRGGRVPNVAVLVDDVHTTGATLHACAVALRAAGAREVLALTYARTLSRNSVQRP
jgi:predicted amidophosphoribosyltransferase